MMCATSLLGGMLLTWSLPHLAWIGPQFAATHRGAEIAAVLAAPNKDVPWREPAESGGAAKAPGSDRSDAEVLAPLAQPTLREIQKRDRPWWDFLGITGPPDPPAMKPPASMTPRQAPAASRRPAAPATGSQRPWWDWAGATKDKKQTKRPPTPRPPGGMPKIKGPPVKRPWWDWMKVTKGEYDMRRRPGRIPTTKVERPWWDWMRITDDAYKPGQRAVRKRTPQPPPQQPQRPWWDWAGVTEDKNKNTNRSTRSRRSPVRRPSQQPRRPWWDWAGVTQDKNKSKNTWSQGSVVRRSSQVQKPQRPWWDWAGVTDKKGNAPSRRRAAPRRSRQPQRPWWDWAGVTKKK